MAAGRLGPRHVAELGLEELAGRGHLRAVHALDANNARQTVDYLYSMDYGDDGFWSGTWGILRSYESPQANLLALPTTITPPQLTQASNAAFSGVCPRTAPLRMFDVTAVEANVALPANGNVTVQDLSPT